MTVLKSVISSGGGGAPNSILDFQAASVVDSVETTLVSYIAASTTRIDKVLVDGEDFAEFHVYINTTKKATIRTGPSSSGIFPLNLGLSTSDVFEIKVEHFHIGETINFECTVLGF